MRSSAKHPIILPAFMRLPMAVQWSGIGRTRLYELMAGGAVRAKKHGTATLVETKSLGAYLRSLPDAEFSAPAKQVA